MQSPIFNIEFYFCSVPFSYISTRDGLFGVTLTMHRYRHVSTLYSISYNKKTKNDANGAAFREIFLARAELHVVRH